METQENLQNDNNSNIVDKGFDEARIMAIKEDIKNYEKSKDDLQKQLDELEKQNIPINQKILNNEISELLKLIDNPEYEYEVKENDEIAKSLSHFSDEYKSIIIEIQDALKIIRKQ